MGRVRVTCGGSLGERELGITAVVGRHWSCDVQLPHEHAPLRWIELRWFRGSWGWRALSREGDTIGPSTWLRPGWRALEPGGGRNGSVRLRDVASIELVDGSAPRPHAVDLQTGQILLHSALTTFLGELGIHQWRTPTGEVLRDGAVLVVRGRALRLHLPHLTRFEAKEQPSILNADTLIKLDRETLNGAIEVAGDRITLPIEMVRLLIPYAEARMAPDGEDDGWLTREDAYDRWIELGGNPDSPPQRLGWTRGKVKSRIAQSGLTDVDALFESQRQGQRYANRLGLAPHQIVLT